MIGQKYLLNQIDDLIEKDFPRFVILTGRKGQGKKYLSSIIAKKLNMQLVEVPDVKIDTIRTIIDMSYKQTEPIMYLISDADKMSLGAKNSLLKVIEEPPNNSYFIITLHQIENTLATIKSRCIHLAMDEYSEDELNEFIDTIKDKPISNDDRIILLDVCKNYHQIALLVKYGVQDFYKYMVKVVDNIYVVSSANSFKLSEKLDVKSDGNGYDIDLFFETFKAISLDRLLEFIDDDIFKKYNKNIEITSKYQQKLSITGINKQSLLDCWILDIRKAWR